MTHDVRHGLANRPRKHRAVCDRNGIDAAADREPNILCVQRDSSGCQLGGKFGSPKAANRRAHFVERRLRVLQYLVEFVLGPIRVFPERAPRKLRLERDDREGVAQDIVHVTRDCIAFAHRRELDIGAFLDLVPLQHHANNHDKPDRQEGAEQEP